jgi:hypothetical protein
MRKAKSITIKRDEAKAYEQLRQWAARDDAARFVLAVLASRPVVVNETDPQKWFVPSSSRAGEFYIVDIELRVCDCAAWCFKHHCSHPAIADRAARLRYELLNDSTSNFAAGSLGSPVDRANGSARC